MLFLCVCIYMRILLSLGEEPAVVVVVVVVVVVTPAVVVKSVGDACVASESLSGSAT